MTFKKQELLKIIEEDSSVQLKQISDLDLDEDAFLEWREKWNTPFVLWLVKESGTIALPIKACVNPVFAETAYDVPCQAFKLDLDAKEVAVLSKDEAINAIYELPNSLASSNLQELRLKSLMAYLKKRYVTDNLLSKSHCNCESSLKEWLSYFEGVGHPLMINLIRELV
ncbi:hypothetical protein F7U66_00555 [Vibrio parahaemolyticus]|nr:hypothetical protein [Vibrio parahaemolyticus]